MMGCGITAGIRNGLATLATLATLAAVAALALAASACAPTPRSVAIPRIEVVQLAALPGGASGQRFRVSLLVDNQNPEPLAIKEVRFTLRITGQGVLTVSHPIIVAVDALDRKTLQIEMNGDTLSSLSQLRAAAGAGNTLPYEIFGNITLDRAFQNMLPFTANGALTLAASER